MSVDRSWSEDPPEWALELMADREWLKAQHRACIALLAHLAEANIVPAEHGILTYINGLLGSFEEREEKLAVPSIRASPKRRALELAAVRRAQEVYFAEAGSTYIRDVAKPPTI